MSKKLITKSAAKLKQRGYKQSASNADKRDRGTGINYTRFKRGGETFLVRAKAYVYEDLASFGEDQVNDALRRDAWLVIYFDDSESFHIFHPRHVEREGVTSVNRSKRSTERVWLDIPMDDGIPLDEFEAGERPPVGRRSSRERSDTTQKGLGDY